jgi:hypothetical protein
MQCGLSLSTLAYPRFLRGSSLLYVSGDAGTIWTLYVWVTRGPFGRLTKSLCDFGDLTPHTLVGGAQTCAWWPRTGRFCTRQTRRAVAAYDGEDRTWHTCLRAKQALVEHAIGMSGPVPAKVGSGSAPASWRAKVKVGTVTSVLCRLSTAHAAAYLGWVEGVGAQTEGFER